MQNTELTPKEARNETRNMMNEQTLLEQVNRDVAPWLQSTVSDLSYSMAESCQAASFLEICKQLLIFKIVFKRNSSLAKPTPLDWRVGCITISLQEDIV